jgi:hypothetical protein
MGSWVVTWEEVRSRPLSEPRPEDDANGKLTTVGCIVTTLSVAVIVAVALPLVRWRDPATGEPLPRMMAILSPILIGAAFHGIVSMILRLVGLPVWAKPEKDESAEDTLSLPDEPGVPEE